MKSTIPTWFDFLLSMWIGVIISFSLVSGGIFMMFFYRFFLFKLGITASSILFMWRLIKTRRKSYILIVAVTAVISIPVLFWSMIMLIPFAI